MRTKNSIILPILFLFLLSSCVETIVVSSITGASLASREKSFADTRNDLKISSKIGFKFVVNVLKSPGNSVDITVNESRIMLTGIIRDAKKAKLANDLCWQVKGVNEVIDEIQIRDNSAMSFADLGNAIKDYYLTLEIESKLLFTKNLNSLNFQITTVDSEVFIMGVAFDKQQLDNVIAIISKTNGVSKVINHVILANDSRRS